MSAADPPAGWDAGRKGWIPVRTAGGPAVLGLREVLAAAERITDIEIGLPPAAGALWRILTVLAARISGLDDPGRSAADWLARRDAVLAAGRFDPVAVEDYFSRHEGRFDLFSVDRPWMQDPRLADECARTSGVNRLIWGRPAGSNQPWMSHHHDGRAAAVAPEVAVLHLLGQLYYGQPGQYTRRRLNGRLCGNAKAGPLRGLVTFHPLADTLFVSLVAGIPYLPWADPAEDAALWESALADPLQPPPPSRGVGGLLAGRFQHAALLVPSDDRQRVVDAYLTVGPMHHHPPAPDPYVIYTHTLKEKLVALPADSHRALWRDFDGLLLADIGIANRRRPTVFDTAEHLPDGLLEQLRVRGIGVDQDRAQCVDRQWYLADTPPVLAAALRDPHAAAAISRIRQHAERGHTGLQTALQGAWQAITGANPDREQRAANPWAAAASARYWPAAETVFWTVVAGADLERGERDLAAAALEVFDTVTAHAYRPRAVAAIETARRQLPKPAAPQEIRTEDRIP